VLLLSLVLRPTATCVDPDTKQKQSKSCHQLLLLL
jgi:hypothetical protein